MLYLISAFIFAYTLAYKTLELWLSMDLHTYKAYSLINLTLYTFAGLYCFKYLSIHIFLNSFSIHFRMLDLFYHGGVLSISKIVNWNH